MDRINCYVIEHHDIYDEPDVLEHVIGSRKEARNRARQLRKSTGVVTERYVGPAAHSKANALANHEENE